MTDTEQQYSIAVIGAGKIGRAVGQLWLRAGHRVCFGSRSPGRLASFVGTLGEQASAKPIGTAAAEGEIALLAVPYPVVDELVPSLQSDLAGKIVIDATNPFSVSPGGRIVSSLPRGLTSGSRMASLFPQSTIVRAFSHIMDELLVSRGTTQAGLWAVAIAGDEPAAKRTVGELVRDAGFVPVDVGTLAESSPLDPGGKLFPHMFTEAEMRAALL